MTPDAVVIGGGLSGLAAAVRIAGAGGRVALFEQSPRLGGRCYSYRDATTGETVDNGQHVLLGSYRELLSYLRAIGSDGFLRAEPSLVLPFHHPSRGFADFRMPALPAPFDLTAGILKYRLLSVGQKAGLLRAGAWLRSWSATKEASLAGLTVAAWLDTLGQDRHTQESFWDPISVSVMNERPGRASALLFAKAMRRAFLGPGADSRLLIPTVGQTELYVDGAVRFLASRGSQAHAGSPVASVRLERGRAAGVALRDGTLVKAGSVIAAVPPWSLPAILSGVTRASALVEAARRAVASPIVSVHLWFDRSFMEGELLGMIGTTVQWAFNRRRILREEGKGGCVSCVISAAGAAVGMTAAELTALATGELAGIFPGARRAKLVHSVVIREKRATFSPTPDAERERPGPETEVAGLLLAGDWTDTGLPATIEGAVLSGHRAAGLAAGG